MSTKTRLSAQMARQGCPNNVHYRTDSTFPYLHLHNGNDFQPRLHIRSHKLSFNFRLVPDCGDGDANRSAIHSKLGIDFSQKLRIRAYLGFGPGVAFCPWMRPCDTWDGVQASGLNESVGAARGVHTARRIMQTRTRCIR